MKDKKVLFSTLWIFLVFNYLYCDLIGLMDSNLLRQYLSGKVEGMVIDTNFLLAAGVLMEIPILMIVLSRLLNDKASAWANIVSAFIKTTVMTATLFMGFTNYYLFFAVIEISTSAFIFITAIKWLKELRKNSPPYTA